jgi:transcriptional regulator with PAS, ATPase and Fis domain
MGNDNRVIALKKRVKELEKILLKDNCENFLNSYSIPVAYLDYNYNFQCINLKFQEFFKISEQQLQGKPVRFFFNKEDYQHSIKPSLDQCAQGSTASHFYLLKDSPENSKHMNIVYLPFQMFRKHNPGIMLMFKLIKIDMVKKPGIHTSFYEWLDIINTLDDVVFTTNNKLEITFINLKGSELFKKSPQQLLGYNFNSIIQSNQQGKSLLNRLLNELHERNESTKSFVKYEGQPFLVMSYPLKNQEGAVNKIVHLMKKLNGQNDNKIFLNEDWPAISQWMDKEYNAFITRLKQNFPQLTEHNLTHCALIRLNYSTKEIARFFNVNPSSIQRSRVRLKKKLGLSREKDLSSFLFNF